MAKASAQAAASGQPATRIAISPINFQTLGFNLRGITPHVQANFSHKTLDGMIAKHKAGSTEKKKTKKEPRDFEAQFREAIHLSTEGWPGIPAAAFRNACIDVCRMTGFKMTFAKMSIFILGDGLDKDSGVELVKLIGGEPERLTLPVRNATGVADVRIRPMWREWGCRLRVQYDADQFTATDVANLLERAGQQVGVGEGRPYSKSSNGMGYGRFTIKD